MDRSPVGAAQIVLEDVSAGYGTTLILDRVSLQVPTGARLAVVGPNGAGKSTLFKVLVGLLPLRGGRVMVPSAAGSPALAYVPQREEIDWRFPVTVEDVVLMGRYGRLGWLRRPGKADREVAARCLAQLGMSHLAHSAIGALSGGQQQRVFLARALAQEPEVLLLDEPFTGVDAATQAAMLALLDELRNQGVTVLLSTHDLNLAAQAFDLVLLLNRHVVAYGPAEQVFTTSALAAAFSGQALVLPGGAFVVDQCCAHEVVGAE